MGIAVAVGVHTDAAPQIGRIGVSATVLPSCQLSTLVSNDDAKASAANGDRMIKAICNLAKPEGARVPNLGAKDAAVPANAVAAQPVMIYATRVNRQESDASQVVRYALNY
jgi:hypothetical protein